MRVHTILPQFCRSIFCWRETVKSSNEEMESLFETISKNQTFVQIQFLYFSQSVLFPIPSFRTSGPSPFPMGSCRQAVPPCPTRNCLPRSRDHHSAPHGARKSTARRVLPVPRSPSHCTAHRIYTTIHPRFLVGCRCHEPVRTIRFTRSRPFGDLPSGPCKPSIPVRTATPYQKGSTQSIVFTVQPRNRRL
jgi:hypothetical protein